MTRPWRAAPLAVLCVLGCEIVGPEHHATFCGQDLCDFTLESGSISEVGTWHPKDTGVSLDEPGTRISRRVELSEECVVFSFLAHVERAGDVTASIDVDGDGHPDWTAPVPSAQWSPMEVTLEQTGGRYAHVVLEKTGRGIVEFAELALEMTPCNALDNELP